VYLFHPRIPCLPLSGVLAIAALRLGASYVTAVDVDAEALVAAEQNLALNDNLDERVEFLHVREVR